MSGVLVLYIIQIIMLNSVELYEQTMGESIVVLVVIEIVCSFYQSGLSLSQASKCCTYIGADKCNSLEFVVLYTFPLANYANYKVEPYEQSMGESIVLLVVIEIVC